jgi:hypothetical protein
VTIRHRRTLVGGMADASEEPTGPTGLALALVLSSIASSRIFGGLPMDARRHLGGRIGLHAVLLALIALVSQSLAVAWAQPAEPGGTTVHEIVSDPGAFYGQTVMVAGAVEEPLGPRSFTLEDDDLLYNDELVVVSSRPVLSDTGDPVDMREVVAFNALVTGIVRPFDLAAIEREVGVDLADDQFVAWAGRPVIVARSVVEWSPGFGPPASRPAGAQQVVRATVDQITDQPSAFYADIVDVTGELERSIGWRSFVMEDNDLLFDEELLVISARPLLDRHGQPLRITTFAPQQATVRVQGHVRAFDLGAIERELDLDLDDSLYTEWTGKPVLIATSVRLPGVSRLPGPGGP